MPDNSIEKARLDAGRLQAVRETELLDSQEETFDRLTQLAGKLTGAPVTFISLVDEARDFYLAACGFPEPLASKRELKGTTFCHYAIASLGPLVIEDTLADPVYREVPTVQTLGVRAYLGVPLVTTDGHAIGSFCAIDFKPRKWSPLDIEVMQELAASTIREINLRKAMDIVRRERSLLDITLRQMPSGVMICDAEGRVLLHNDLATSITGRVFIDLRNAPAGRAFKEDGTPYTRDDWPLTRSIRGGEAVRDEIIHFTREDGADLVLRVSSSPVRDGDGQIVAGVLTIHDVTRFESLLADLREERSRLRTLLEYVPAGVLVAEAPSGRIVMGNRKADELLGHPLENVPGIDGYRRWRGIRADGSEVAPDMWPLARAVRGETVRGEDIQYEQPDGQVVWFRIYAAPVLDGERNVTGGIVTFHDVDELRRFANENQRLLVEAQRANAEKDAFFAAVSHELRTPMTAIIGWSRLLRMDLGDNPDLVEAASMIESSAALQAQLVDDLLDVSRISTGKIVLHKKALSIDDVVQEAVRAAEPAAEAKGIRLRAKLGDGQLIDADHARLRQVFGNLISNAVKFTPPGGLVKVDTYRSDEFVCVSVGDTGRGIAPELLPRIFERGLQAHNAELGGLGLGLTIVRHLAMMHGGDVRAESGGTGQGATFTVRLPAVTPGTPGTTPDTAPAGPSHTTAS